MDTGTFQGFSAGHDSEVAEFGGRIIEEILRAAAEHVKPQPERIKLELAAQAVVVASELRRAPERYCIEITRFELWCRPTSPTAKMPAVVHLVR
jgi:hypothetical protein